MNNGILGGGCDADIEGYFPAINPLLDEDVSSAGKSTRDKARHFLEWTERGVLRSFVYFVTQTVVTAALHAIVISAVEGVIP